VQDRHRVGAVEAGMGKSVGQRAERIEVSDGVEYFLAEFNPARPG
jgi:hypothetical protein